MNTNAKLSLRNLLLAVSLASLTMALATCSDRQSALSVKDSSASIPIERTGLDGEYDPNGLAKRVARALEKDTVLRGIPTVYVAQNDSKIVFKGTILNKTFLNRLVEVARDVRGVTEVDTSQVKIINQVW